MDKRELKTTEAIAVLHIAIKRGLIDVSNDELYKQVKIEEGRCVIAKQVFYASQAIMLPGLMYYFRYTQGVSWSVSISRATMIGCFSLIFYVMSPPMRRYPVLYGDLARSRRKELKGILEKLDLEEKSH